MTGYKWFLKMGELSDASRSGLISTAYELLDCQYGFYQEVDNFGKAETNVRLAGINIVYDGLPTSDIIKWAMSSQLYYNGALILYDDSDEPQEKLFFEDGACTHMHISYLADGDSYATTNLTIYPRVLKIGDNRFEQPWTLSNESEYLKTHGRAIIDGLSQPIGKTNARMNIGNLTYELETFDIDFNQRVDWKGQPIEDMRGGIMQCAISGQPQGEIKAWALSSRMLKDGSIEFYQELVNSPLRIEFMEACCVEMTPYLHGNGGLRTQMTISPNGVSLNGKSLFKNWKL
jgi:hypothetical protein